jgi:RNA polymerase sigma factor (sigma-70 family)
MFDNDDVLRRVYEIAYAVARARFRLGTADAEDIAQEMMLRALHHLRSREINASWIHRGAQFLCIDHLRARQSEGKALERYLREGTPRAKDEATILDLELAVSSLHADCQSLIRQYFWEGRTWAEIDAALAAGRRCAQYRTRKCVEALAQAFHDGKAPKFQAV